MGDLCDGKTILGATQHPDLEHLDAHGPIKHSLFSGNKYFLTSMNDYRSITWVYLLKEKKEGWSTLKGFEILAEKWSGCRRLKRSRTDKSVEYTSREFDKYCKYRMALCINLLCHKHHSRMRCLSWRTKPFLTWLDACWN